MEWPSPQFVSRLWKQTSGVPRPMGRSNKHHRRPWYTWSKHHGCHPSEHTGQAMLITTGANKHRSMRSRCPNRVLRRKMCCSPPCSSTTVRDRQTHRTRDARLIAAGLGEDCWPRESPIAFANSLIQEPARARAERARCCGYWPSLSCCAMKASAVSATSRHPWSMTRECPRLGISRISVTAGFFSCCL